jgi:hypothetical protein
MSKTKPKKQESAESGAPVVEPKKYLCFLNDAKVFLTREQINDNLNKGLKLTIQDPNF